MRLFLRSLALAAAVAAGSTLAGCHDADPEPQPGVFSGVVTTMDEVGRPESAAGITISLEGGSQTLTATTDAAGTFEFKNLPFGTYNATLKRTDLGTSRAAAIVLDAQHPAEKRKLEMGKPSTVNITSFSLTGPSRGPDSVPFTIGVSYDMNFYTKGYSVVAYVSNEANVSNSNYLSVHFGGSSNNFGVLNQLQSAFSLASLRKEGFASGSTVYVVVYGAAAVNTHYYTAPDSRGFSKSIISNLNPARSPVLSFTMP